MVLKANEEAEKAVTPGIPLSSLDQISRGIITDKGYGSAFTHRLGHIVKVGCFAHKFLFLNIFDCTCLIKCQRGIYKTGGSFLVDKRKKKSCRHIFINQLETVPEDLGVEKVRFTDSDSYMDLVIKTTDHTEPLGIDKNMPARFLP